MRVLDDRSKAAVRRVIAAHADALAGLPGFVSAEPGFAIVDGRVVREPAIIVFVAHKKPKAGLVDEDHVPRHLGPYRVAVMQADPERQLAAAGTAAIATRAATSLTYRKLDGNPIDQPFVVGKPILCHVGPDAGWPVLKPFLQATTRTLSIAMYDFNADHVAKTVIEVVRRQGVRAELTWDDGMAPEETAIRTLLQKKLGSRLDGQVVRCGGGHRFASAYHEKVAVRDSRALWLSSGNWSTRSQPDIDPVGDAAAVPNMYAKGNREWHVIVDDAPLAALFERYIEYDLEGSKEEAALREAAPPMPDVFVPLDVLQAAARDAPPPSKPQKPRRLPSTPRDVKVRPVLTPDNYVKHVLALVKSARKKLYLQYAYIVRSGNAADRPFAELLDVLAERSWRTDFDLRIIVGNNAAADRIRVLAEAGFNDAVFRVQRNVHNKGIVADRKAVLVSSANWSGDGVLRNRDAGLIVFDPEVAGYFEDVFVDDWTHRANAFIADDPPVRVATGRSPPPGMVRMTWQDWMDE